MAIEKKCFCGRTVVDRSGKVSIAAICDECRFDETILPSDVFPKEPKCGNCGSDINFIGAFIAKELPWPRLVCLYYDCPKASCSDRRMSLLMLAERERNGGFFPCSFRLT